MNSKPMRLKEEKTNKLFTGNAKWYIMTSFYPDIEGYIVEIHFEN